MLYFMTMYNPCTYVNTYKQSHVTVAFTYIYNTSISLYLGGIVYLMCVTQLILGSACFKMIYGSVLYVNA